MTNGLRGPSSSGRAAGSRRLPYDTIRDRFIAEPPEGPEALDFYARLGMFIWSRWEAIASDDPNGQIVNEDSSPRWDECTEREFEDIRSSADALVEREVARRRVRAAVAAVVKNWGAAGKVFGWVGMRVLEALVTAIALIFWAWLFIHLAPHLQAAAKAVLNG